MIPAPADARRPDRGRGAMMSDAAVPEGVA